MTGGSHWTRARACIVRTWKDRNRRVVWFATIYSTAVLLAYFVTFRHQLSWADLPVTDKWGQFGDFLSGTLNPVISLVTLWYLANSYMVQVDQMKATLKQTHSQMLSTAVRESSAMVIPELGALDRSLNDLAVLNAKQKHVPQDLVQSIVRSAEIINVLCSAPDLDKQAADKLYRLVGVALRSDERIDELQALILEQGYSEHSPVVQMLTRARDQLRSSKERPRDRC